MSRKQYTIHYIYKTTCILTGKFYIGMHSTFNLDDGYIGSGKILWRSIKKYGIENHKKEILEFCKDRIELKYKEKEIVNRNFIQNKNNMNIMEGGGGGFISDEQQRQRSIAGANAFKNKLKTDLEFKKWWSKKSSETMTILHKKGKIKYDTFTRKKHTEETKKKIAIKNSENHIGEKNSQYGKCWIYNDKLLLSKSIIKNDLEKWILLGWIKGRKYNCN